MRDKIDDIKEVRHKLALLGIDYRITKTRYGSGLKAIYTSRLIYDHDFFNRRGFGIIVNKKEVLNEAS